MQENTTAAPPAKLDDEVRALEQRTRDFHVVKVTDAETFEAGGRNLRELKTLQDEVEAVEKSATGPLVKSLETIRGWFRPMREYLKKSDVGQRAELAAWKTAQERIEREARAKAEADARAERQRLEAEARAKELEARREAEAKRQAAEEAKRKGDAAAAAKLEASATSIETKAHARADVLRDRAEAVVADPTPPSEAPKVAGLADRRVWKYEITDATKIAAGFLTPDETKIGKTVKALKGDAAAVIGPGIRVWEEADFSARRTR